MTSFAITLYGQCYRLHVGGQQVVSVIHSYWSICSLCFESNNTSLLLRLLIDVVGTSILFQIRNIAYRTTWRGVLGDPGMELRQNLVTSLHLIYKFCLMWNKLMHYYCLVVMNPTCHLAQSAYLPPLHQGGSGFHLCLLTISRITW